MPPINENQAHQVKLWLTEHFGADLSAAVEGQPFDIDLLCAIAGKEAALYWLGWIQSETPDVVLARCVFDASGDAPHAPRSAFPQNTASFRAKYGDDFTADLIGEANKTRALRHMAPAAWVYKGYGIFQYDLQFVVSDEGFFRNRQWGDISACLRRSVGELSRNYQRYGDLRTAVRAYNGNGPAAEQYADDVMQLLAWCSEV